MFALTEYQISEEAMCFGLTTMSDDMEVLTYPDMVVYSHGIQECEPVTSNKLPVCHKMSNASVACNAKELCDEILAVLGAGVSYLVHHLEDNRKGHPIVVNAKGKYVDVRVAELPVCPVKRQRIRSFYRYEL